MIYLVTANQKLFENEDYKIIGISESLSLLSPLKILQFDTETSGKDVFLDTLLLVQFGSKTGDFQIVIDCTTIDIKLYKEILETKWLIGHNLKFDLPWLYNYNIVPRKIYDTMIVEQLLYLGYPKAIKRYNLHDVAYERLGINIDKSVRGEIIWRGIDSRVIQYAANDVVYLEDIMYSQAEECKKKGCLVGASLECACVAPMAYLEYCGIKMDADKWKAKMEKDEINLKKRKEYLDNFVVNNNYSKFYSINLQGSLFDGFDTTPKCTINWDSPAQVIKFAKELGFNTSVIDKKTGEDKDSVLEKHLKMQKGVNDEFLKLYFDYKESSKKLSSFGQGHINLIHPITGRIHTNYWQLGAKSGRMSSGSGTNPSIAKYKHLSESKVKMVNMQQLPKDAETRGCFIAEKGNLFCSCDYSAMEARIGAEVYNEKMLLDEFLYRSGDTHSAYAKVVFSEELKDVPVDKIAEVRPDLRNKVKSVEFAVQFGSDGTAVAPQLGIPVEEARKLVNNLLEGMKGLKEFKERGSKKVRKLGYVTAMEQTGHKTYWWDHDKWLERQKKFTSEFWEDYKLHHKGTGDYIAQEVREHFQAASTWDRYALNVPTQGGGAVVLKDAIVTLWNWILDNGYFKKILFVNFSHDEINSEYPKEVEEWPNIVAKVMEESAAKYFYKLPIPAKAEVGDHWIH